MLHEIVLIDNCSEHFQDMKIENPPALKFFLLEKSFLSISICRLAVSVTNKEGQKKKFGDFLTETEVFKNPASIDNLIIDSGLDPRKSYSLTMSSKGKFQSDEYAKDLRQVHASKLAFR